MACNRSRTAKKTTQCMSLPRWHHPLRRGAFLRHDVALHFLARPKQYPLSESERTDLIQVVEGFTSPHDHDAARRGIEWMREHYRRLG